MIGVSYMGTKQKLANTVGSLIADCRDGTFLDLFAGMSSVGSAVGAARQIWANDLQVFSCEVAKARFCSTDLPLSSYKAAESCHAIYEENRSQCRRLYKSQLAAERDAIARESARLLSRLHEDSVTTTRKAVTPDHAHQLFTRYFGGSYFGVSQAIDADSIRAAIDRLASLGRLTTDQHRWLVLALCVALSRCSTSTGHFAQPLAPKSSNLIRYIQKRQRNVWAEWLASIDRLVPIGASAWRKRNRVFNKDACSLLEQTFPSRDRPRVIYADPPYTKDQYSRYYHLYETAVLYDYPGTFGRGQYRGNRSISHFCLSSKVEAAFEDLIERSASTGSDLIISYPTNGLMPNSRRIIPLLMSKWYRHRPYVLEVGHAHSTMGASKGPPKTQVVEVFYRVKRHD
jgi:adenine-specific DNA-methyltransferase